MDLTISLPEHVSEEAQKIADEMEISLNELLALALRRYLGRYRGELITEALNAVYELEPSALDPTILRLQSASIGSDEW